METKGENPVDLYNNVYSGFGSDAEVAVRRQTYGEDIGQSSWMTAAEWLRFADQLGVTAASEVLEVGSGSGGPAIYLALNRKCRVKVTKTFKVCSDSFAVFILFQSNGGCLDTPILLGRNRELAYFAVR